MENDIEPVQEMKICDVPLGARGYRDQAAKVRCTREEGHSGDHQTIEVQWWAYSWNDWHTLGRRVEHKEAPRGGHMERFEGTEVPEMVEGEIRYEDGHRWVPNE